MKKDKRDCPECGTRMVLKGDTCWNLDEGDSPLVLWQCPKCKNVEIL